MSSLPEHDPLLLLASGSSGRRELLTRARIDFRARAADVDEDAALTTAMSAAGGLTPDEQVLVLARAKAQAGLEASDGGYVVLGCDSMLEVDGQVLGKPHTAERARERWRQLRGCSGILHTGHWLIDDRDAQDGGSGAALGAAASTVVHFAAITDAELDAYIATGEPLGVAGAFTIDGIGAPFIERIEGDPSTVVGLSLPLLRTLLAEIGMPISALWIEPAAPDQE